MSLKCQKCHKSMQRIPDGTYLTRVNELGVTGIWECRPTCGRTIGRTKENALLDAIDSQIQEQAD